MNETLMPTKEWRRLMIEKLAPPTAPVHEPLTKKDLNDVLIKYPYDEIMRWLDQFDDLTKLADLHTSFNSFPKNGGRITPYADAFPDADSRQYFHTRLKEAFKAPKEHNKKVDDVLNIGDIRKASFEHDWSNFFTKGTAYRLFFSLLINPEFRKTMLGDEADQGLL